MVEIKLLNADVNIIMFLAEGILRFLENDEDEYKMNQYLIGMNNLFRCFIEKCWKKLILK